MNLLPQIILQSGPIKNEISSLPTFCEIGILIQCTIHSKLRNTLSLEWAHMTHDYMTHDYMTHTHFPNKSSEPFLKWFTN